MLPKQFSQNWMQAISPTICDGYIAGLAATGARIVADGFHFTDEIRFDAREEWLCSVLNLTSNPMKTCRLNVHD